MGVWRLGGVAAGRGEARWSVRLNSFSYDQCRAFDGRLLPGAGDRVRGGRGSVPGPAGHPPGPGRELDRVAVLAPGPGPGRSPGRRVRGGAGVARFHGPVRAAVRV